MEISLLDSAETKRTRLSSRLKLSDAIFLGVDGLDNVVRVVKIKRLLNLDRKNYWQSTKLGSIGSGGQLRKMWTCLFKLVIQSAFVLFVRRVFQTAQLRTTARMPNVLSEPTIAPV